MTRGEPEPAFTKATVIVNPAAGAGRRGRVTGDILKYLKACVHSVEVAWTQRPGNAIDEACKAVTKGTDLLVAAGGDGTVNEVVNGLIVATRKSGRHCSLAIVPLGSTCSLAKELGIPRGTASVRIVTEGAVRAIDVLALKWTTPDDRSIGRVAVTVTNFGFGGAVARRVEAETKRLGGFVAYARGAVAELFRYKGKAMIIEVDGKELTRSRLLCAVVANTRWEGGGMCVAPDAKPDDGMLDVVVVEDLPLPSRMRYFPTVYAGRHVSLPMVQQVQGTKVVVRSSETVPFEYDGEYAECRECSIEVLPKALDVLVPEKNRSFHPL